MKSKFLILSFFAVATVVAMQTGALAASKPAAKKKEPVVEASVAASQAEALKKYPDFGKADSEFNKAFVERVKVLRAEKPDLFKDPAWPMKVADEVAQKLSKPAIASALGPLPPGELSTSFGQSTPEKEGMSSEKLADLTEWVRDSKPAIFSILISRNGKLVYELYTTSLGRDEAHYLMSVTKTFTSALVGIAMDKGLLPGPDSPVTKTLPPSLFESDADFKRFSAVSIKHVMGMSALDAPIAPHSRAEDAVERLRKYKTVNNRPRYALTQKLLPEPGVSCQYNDLTPLIATALIQIGTGKSEMEFAEETLFGPLGFKNAEWMGQDPAGFDNGSYDLRLRPIDMQKFGILFLNGGVWNGRQIVSRAWVERSFQSWIRCASYAGNTRPEGPANYGWFWWAANYGPGFKAHEAGGMWGQRIIVVPEQHLVVTITGYMLEDNVKLCDTIMRQYVVPTIQPSQGPPANMTPNARLSKALADVRFENRMPSSPQTRMVPVVAPKERHRNFSPSDVALGSPPDVVGILQSGQFTAPPNEPGKRGYIPLTHQQEEKNLCVPTSAAMILQHFGSAAQPSELMVGLFRDLISKVANLGFTWRVKNYPLTKAGGKTALDEVKKSIDEGGPVMIDTCLYGGHTFVAVGYDEGQQSLIIMDTKLPAPGLRVISYKNMEEIWNSRGVGFYGRASVFTAPKP